MIRCRLPSTFAAAALAACLATPAAAAEHTHTSAPPKRSAAPRPTLAVGVAFDAAGRLWRVRHGADGVWLDHSDDLGASFAPAVRAAPEAPAADGELAPEIALGADGTLHIAYTAPRPDNPMVGHIRFTHSSDGGVSFAPPVTVNDNREEITHRFQATLVDAAGNIHMAWIDKRDLEAAKRRQGPYRGAAIYYARGREGRFAANAKLADHSCECCRIALALDPDGVPVAFWRQVFEDGARDHALARLDGSAVTRATFEGWRIDACPHHGPALAIGPDRLRHLAWFTGAGGDGRVLYQAQEAAGNALAAPRRVGGEQAGHPALIVAAGALVLAWKEFDGTATRAFVQRSADGGRTWSAPRALAASRGPSDRPRLVARGETVYLAWNARDEGFRLLPVGED